MDAQNGTRRGLQCVKAKEIEIFLFHRLLATTRDRHPPFEMNHFCSLSQGFKSKVNLCKKDKKVVNS